MYGSEVWCLKESMMGILQRTERSMVRAMYGIQLMDRKRVKDLVLDETIDQLAMANCVLKMEDGCHVLQSTLIFGVEGQRRKERPKGTWKKQVKEDSMKVGLNRGDALCWSKWIVGFNQIVSRLRCVRPPSVDGDTIRFRRWSPYFFWQCI